MEHLHAPQGSAEPSAGGTFGRRAPWAGFVRVVFEARPGGEAGMHGGVAGLRRRAGKNEAGCVV